ncbi:MAG: protein-L-isoaspartate(D-aspartate) O-methyltransferase [Candidatus Omnitrophica bacterium]|nr:protein-L-isoaspartate(D-aspartate) O-methyltransferase [Candidatus Omnitrophota bacterium]
MDFEFLRQRMVDEQLIPRGISDRAVLSVFRKVPRHEFVPQDYMDSAYDDHPLPIGGGQTISQPYMVALMTEQLNLKGGEKILEIGAGSGYQAAILAEIASEVYTVERIETLAEKCDTALKNLGYKNIKVVVSDGTLGYEGAAPYDGIIVTCGAPEIPSSYIEQLKIGGILVIPIGSQFSQVLTVIKKTKEGIETKEVCGCVFVPLIGKDGWKR